MTINILDSDWTKHYFTLHFKMWLTPLKGAREVNITFEHCSVYPKNSNRESPGCLFWKCILWLVDI
jgi:hypothetical protein